LLADSLSQFCRIIDCKICPAGPPELYSKEWHYRELKHCFSPLRQYNSKDHREELFIRRDIQEITLAILDYTDPRTQVYLDINNSPLYQRWSTCLAVLQVTDSNGRSPCLVLESHTNSGDPFKSFTTSIYFINNTFDLPEPRLIHVLSGGATSSGLRPAQISFEFQSTVFRIKAVEASSAMLKENQITNQKFDPNALQLPLKTALKENQSANQEIEIHVLPLPWQCKVVIPGPEDTDWYIRLIIRGGDGSSEACRLVEVLLNSYDSEIPSILTPPDFSSDEYELRLDKYPCALISIHRLPKQFTGGTMLTGLVYRHQLHMDWMDWI